MGVLSLWRSLTDSDPIPTSSGGDVAIRSPFAGDLAKIVTADLENLFGTEFDCISREQAMTLPGVQRARAILLSLIADKPLQAWRGDALAGTQPSFLYRTPGLLGPWQRMAKTLDDLFFYPYSLWLTQRGTAAGEDGRKDILNAVHCPYWKWHIDDLGRIMVANQDGGYDAADEDEVILIPGPSEGLIAYASRTIRGAAALESAWVDRARNPQAITELHLNDDTQLDDEETIATRDAWVNARRATNGAVAVTPSNIDVIDHGSTDPAMFTEGRNQSRLDIAAFFNLPGAILDASTAQSSLTYVTQEGTRTSVYDLSLPYWVRPIEARLSQDDIVAAGQSIRFDFSSLAPTAPKIATED